MTPLLDAIHSPADLKKLSRADLPLLAAEIRAEIIRVVSQSGGHLASSLGAVELIIALHYVLNAPEDKIVFDVGHQAYAHKLLTGRRDRFATLRQGAACPAFPGGPRAGMTLPTPATPPPQFPRPWGWPAPGIWPA